MTRCFRDGCGYKGQGRTPPAAGEDFCCLFACLRNCCLKLLPRFSQERSHMSENLCLLSLPRAIPCERRKEHLNSIDCFKKSPAPPPHRIPAHEGCPPCLRVDAEGCGWRPAGRAGGALGAPSPPTLALLCCSFHIFQTPKHLAHIFVWNLGFRAGVWL